MGSSAKVEGFGGRIADFGAEGLDHFVARLEVGAADEVDAVGHGGEDARDIGLPSASFRPSSVSRIDFGWPGQVEDQRAAADHGDLARQDRGRHELQADAAHLLAEARHLAIGHGERGLGRHVARRRAGAAGGDHEVAALLVDELA